MTTNTRVLFADDDPSVRGSFARLLRGRGFIVDLASDGDEALAFAEEYPYALVVTDHQMPAMSGLELLEHLRELQPGAASALVTGFPEVAARVRNDPGIGAVLTKPWQDSQVLELAQNAVRDFGRWQDSLACEAATAGQGAEHWALLLEDNDFDASILTSALESADSGHYRLVRVASLGEACERLKAREYSVILSDLSLPDADGLTAIKELHAVAPATPILVVTGATDEEQALRAMQAGAQDYLLKGQLDGATVLRAIRYASERKRNEERLTHLANYDALTDLANRTLLAERMSRAFTRGARSGKRTALLLVDLDHFKAVNDTFGHEVGDHLLVEVARRLQCSTRAEDTVARIGGDEFAVMLEDLPDFKMAQRFAQRIINAFKTPLVIQGKEMPTRASVGVAVSPDHAQDHAGLMRLADGALYQAKRSGRGCYCVVGQSVDSGTVASHTDESILRQKFEERYVVVYALTFGARQRRVCQREASLMSASSPPDGSTDPDSMLGVETSAEVIAMGAWMLGQALLSVKEGLDDGSQVVVPLSSLELADTCLVARVKTSLQIAGVEPSRLVFQLSEKTLNSLPEGGELILEGLAEHGIALSLTGYGTERTSILELARLPLSTIRLSPAWLDVVADKRGCLPLQALIAAAHVLEWKVLATAVETLLQLRLLSELGCDGFEGPALGSDGFGQIVELDTDGDAS